MPNLPNGKAASKGKAKVEPPRRRVTARAHFVALCTFPMFRYASGQWAAKVNKKISYFGKWNGGDGSGTHPFTFLRTVPR
ncbi:MAG TPA: hypothetical protein VHC22_24450 [Pirellulales bacterium]|nr:hypothetical protein [Pirellulales bacterium]